MLDDDRPIGQVLSRREVLASLGALACAAIPGGALVRPPGGKLPACVVRPAQTEGPYFVDTMLDRSDIRADPASGRIPEGVPLALAFQVSRISGTTCAPLPGVLVDVWQCDAAGVYSGVKDINGFFDTTGQQFLRGHQRTGADGRAAFRTIYPGWYQGRTVHIHFKLRTDPAGQRGYDFTSQLYFDDTASDQVLAATPYAGNRQPRTRNPGDGIFRRERGAELVLDVQRDGAGYRGVFDIGLVLE